LPAELRHILELFQLSSYSYISVFLLGYLGVSVKLHSLEASQQFNFLQGRVVNPTPNPKPENQGIPFSLGRHL
jgi:hypothetical protein